MLLSYHFGGLWLFAFYLWNKPFKKCKKKKKHQKKFLMEFVIFKCLQLIQSNFSDSTHISKSIFLGGFFCLWERNARVHIQIIYALIGLCLCSWLDYCWYFGHQAECSWTCTLRAERWVKVASIVWVLFFSGNYFHVFSGNFSMLFFSGHFFHVFFIMYTAYKNLRFGNWTCI